jgi:hypothetical protein
MLPAMGQTARDSAATKDFIAAAKHLRTSTETLKCEVERFKVAS